MELIKNLCPLMSIISIKQTVGHKLLIGFFFLNLTKLTHEWCGILADSIWWALLF